MELTKEIWTQSDYDEFAEYLKTLADEKYKKFSDSLVPGGTQSIGIRVPILRQTAKAISKGDYASFLNCKNNAYREEIMIKGLVMEFYLTDEYIDKVLSYVNSVNSDFYYVQMMQGWLVATAAAKCRDKTMKFLESNDLNATTQNMAVRKIRESLRISKEDKELVLQFKK